MRKLMNFPLYIPVIGIIVSFALIIFVTYVPNKTLMFTGVTLFQLSGLVLAAKFFLCFLGFFSTSLDT